MNLGGNAASMTVSVGDATTDNEPRTLPHNVEAEQALLGAILVDNLVLDRVSTFLDSEHFHVPVHGRIYDVARTLIQRGQLATPITLKAAFDNDAALGEVGGAQYLNRLAMAAVSLVNAEDYGRVVYDLAIRRALIRMGEEIVETAFDPTIDDPATEQIERAEHQLFQLAETGAHEGGFVTFGQSLTAAVRSAEAAYKREGKLSGVSTGLVDMDNLLGGLHNSDLLILAGRPSMGKTALATNIAFHAAKMDRDDLSATPKGARHDGHVVAFFSLEMSAEQLATRILAEESGLRSDHIRRGKLSDEEFVQRLVPASQRLSSVPLYIDDTPALTIPALRTRARRLKRTHGLHMVVVDYLQLLRAASRVESRVQEISEITQGLKAMAKELDVPVLALSQLSRAVEQREDKRPLLSDLRESGSIEQDADVVMFVYREIYYLERGEPQQRGEEKYEHFMERYDRWQERCEQAFGLAEVIVAKQRHGPIGVVKARFDANTTRFQDYASADHLPEPRS